MRESVEGRLERVLAELRAAEDAVARTERELGEASFAVVSSDRAVRATVGARGEVTSLEFLEGRYRDMSSQELAASVLEAMGAARVRMNRHVMKAMAPFTQPSGEVLGVKGFDVDWARIFGPEVLEEDGEDGGAGTVPAWRDALGED